MSFVQKAARRTADAIGRNSKLIRSLRPTYESCLGWISRGRGIPWSINGMTFRIDPRYRDQIAPEYDPAVAAFLQERVQPGAVCLDVGANVGVYVLQFAQWSSPEGRIVAFEPNPAAREVLQRHIHMNDLSARVEIVEAAVGSTIGDALFYASEADGMSRLGKANPLIADHVTAISVPTTTLDSYCQANNLEPDWLLIDIEGFEIAALTGSANLIKRRGRELGIIVEMHPNAWPIAGTTRIQAECLLADLGLRAIPLTGQTDALSEYGQIYLTHT